MSELLEGPRAVTHLLRRAGFGPDPTSLERFAGRSYEQVVEELLGELDAPPRPDPAGFDPYAPGAIQQLWLERMVSGQAPLAERLALFWHGHFATSNAKVRDGALMWAQYQRLRRHGAGALETLLLEVSRDVAMIRWLDGNSNRAGHPNENYGRELMELFSLGIGHYDEGDVREVARAFTGWGSRHHAFVFSEAFHDAGEKTILGRTGRFGGAEVVALLAAEPACHRFIATKLLRQFSHPEPTPAEVDAVAAILRGSSQRPGTVRDALRAIFLDPAFRRRERALVKEPVAMVVGALRCCGFRHIPPWVHGALDRMGQILFRPPSVKGWPAGVAWLSSAGVVERLRVAQRLGRETPADQVAQVEALALEDRLSPGLRTHLDGLSGGARVAAILASPEFQLA